MTYWILLVLAIALTIISLKWRNLLFSFGGSLGWLALWQYHQTSPPSGITVGSFVHEVIYYVYIIFAIANMVMWLSNRQRGYTGYPMTKREELQLEERNIKPVRGLLDLNNMEYRDYIHSRMRGNRRR